MATNAEREEERTSVSERISTVRPDELGEETLSFGERLIFAQQVESMRADIRNGDRLVHERIGRLDERISALMVKNADAIAANAVAIAKNAEGIEALKALIAINAEGIADNRKAISEGLAENRRLMDEGLAENRRLMDEGLAENRRLIEANAQAISALTEKVADIRVGIKADVIAANKEERDRSYIRKGWFVAFVAAIVGSGLAVGLTIAAVQLGLMSF